MFFEGSFYSNPYDLRKLSLESMETSTASSGSGSHSKYKTEVVYLLFSSVNSGGITFAALLDLRYFIDYPVPFCTWAT